MWHQATDQKAMWHVSLCGPNVHSGGGVSSQIAPTLRDSETRAHNLDPRRRASHDTAEHELGIARLRIGRGAAAKRAYV
jgi:hypothetical protein